MGDTKHHSEQTYKVKLSEKPCVVQYVHSFNCFVVGTYDLLPTISSAKDRFPELSDEELLDKYDSINKRVGSLNLFRPTSTKRHSRFRLEETFQCQHGGIFDMSISNILNDSIYVAHANGFIGLYEFDHGKFKFCESIKVTICNSTLLTSIDTCRRSERGLLVAVGDSTGCLTIVEGNQESAKLSKILSKCNVTKYADPVWQVKFITCPATMKFIILVAAEDSSWYLYRFDIKPEESSFQLLYTNCDFAAGVTSICVLPKKLIIKGWIELKVMLGSYDESMRKYEIKIRRDLEAVDVRSLLNSPIVIQGGGIWRMKYAGSVLYIAAMYAGTHGISSYDLYEEQKIEPVHIKIEEGESSKDDNHMIPLHYGVDYSPQNSVACIVDYNNNCCIFDND